MAQVTVSIGVKVAPWMDRYLDMVARRFARTGVPPLMDVVDRVIMRGIRPYVAT
ncbi:hypothetical protein D3C87_2160470 [compost metagenome]